MSQLSLFEAPPERLARRTDPDSSHQAAARAQARGIVDRHSRQVYGVLRAAGGAELTSEEIADRSGLSVVQVCRRLGRTGALLSLGLVARIERPRTRLAWRALA